MPTKPRDGSISSLQHVLDDTAPLFQQLAKQLARIKPFQRVWHTVVNAPLNQHSRPVHIDSGRLTVWADSPVWASRLRHSEQTILSRLRSHGLSEVRTLRVRVQPVDAGARPAAVRPQEPPADDVLRILESTAEGIRDAELRAAILRLRDRLRGTRR